MSSTSPRFVTESLAEIKTDWLIVPVSEQSQLPADLQALDQAVQGTLGKLQEQGDLKGKPGEVTLIPTCPGIAAKRLLLIGVGPVEKLTLQRFEQAALTGVRKAAGTANSSICIVINSEISEKLGSDRASTSAAYASVVGASGPAHYKAETERFPLQETLIHVASASVSDEALTRGRILGEAVNLTRELVNRHPEEIYPETFANRAADIAADLGITGEIFDVPRLQQERMGALLAVARGSAHEPRVVVLRYQGAGEDAPWLALCGKGVTFDSGGLSIKPSDSMITMKGDMAGAATVLGTLTALAKLKVPVNVIGVVGLAENMIGPHSYKMGEVLTARNGTTIEVHNTDAEGRIVLSDVLAYTVEQKPACLVDLATLTGACVVALGMDIVGAFTNNQEWCDKVLAASKKAGEDLWQMPMNDSFNEQLKCDFADIKNVGTRWGGAITAAKFLERFVDGTPWVHLDIAGPAYAESAKPYRDIGGTGIPLRTLVELAEEFSNQK